MRLGRYELLYRLAKGGMGEVFVARRKGPGDIEKRVVIKRIRRDLSGDARFVDMFLREAKVSMTLSHKNIAAVFDFGRAGQELFLAMEHVHGRDLARALSAAKKAETPLSMAAAAYIGIEVCRALEYAHKSGGGGQPIIHRDLSPKNLLVSFSGEIVVADFGLAVESGEQRDGGGVRGTPAYLSPEQARGEALDGRSDLFSLGLVLRELVTGKPAYVADTPRSIIELAKTAALDPIGQSVPTALRSVIEKATAADHNERFDDAWAMQVALDDYLISARASGAAPPGNEIAEWLRSLFGDSEPESPEAVEAPEDGAPLAAVTFLEDGEDALSRELRDVTASLAVTIGDSELDDEPAVESADESRPSTRAPSRLPLLAAVLGLVATLAAGAAIATRTACGDSAATPDASALNDAEPVLDASAIVETIADAGPPIDASIDARARPVAPASGWLRVHSRPWARVAVRGSPGCAETPCRIKLPAGKHTIVLDNPVTGAQATRRVDVVANETTDLSVVLSESTP